MALVGCVADDRSSPTLPFTTTTVNVVAGSSRIDVQWNSDIPGEARDGFPALDGCVRSSDIAGTESTCLSRAKFQGHVPQPPAN
ncbi:MAG TPA: hypothetical protein VGM90_02395 [Kofleriaceae bacterium]